MGVKGLKAVGRGWNNKFRVFIDEMDTIYYEDDLKAELHEFTDQTWPQLNQHIPYFLVLHLTVNSLFCRISTVLKVKPWKI